MNCKIYIFSILLSSFINAHSQVKELEINYERNEDKSVNFSFKKLNPGSTFIVLKFRTLSNSTGKRLISKSVKGHSGSFLRLNPINKKKGIGFSFTYSYQMGTKNAKVDKNFKYILPFLKGKKVISRDVNYLGKRFGNSSPKNWKSIQFLTELNDTVCASRKGIVVKIVDKYDADDTIEYTFKSKSNFIIIEHSDGTLAKYNVLKKNSTMVALGEKVYPSTPIALAGSYDKPENSQLRFSVYYLDNDVDYEFNKQQTLANKKHYYAYVNPIFYVSDETTQLQSNKNYVTHTRDDIIQFEMTKREKKKLLKQNKK